METLVWAHGRSQSTFTTPAFESHCRSGNKNAGVTRSSPRTRILVVKIKTERVQGLFHTARKSLARCDLADSPQ